VKEDIKRIMKLVQEGKLSPEDATDLIEAFEQSREEQAEAEEAPPQESSVKQDGFSAIMDSIERMGRKVSTTVDWQEIAAQVKEGTKKGVEAVKHAAEQARKGKNPFSIFGSQELKDVTLPLDVPSGKTLRIENPSGDVRVFGGETVGTVVARAVIRGHDSEDAQSKADRYTLVVEESDHTVLVKQPDVTGVTVDLELRFSGKAPIEVRCENGDIEVYGCVDGCRIWGSNGDIRLGDLKGNLEVSTQSGDVSLLKGKLNQASVETKSGDVQIEDVNANANIRTSSGDVRMTRCSGKSIAVEAVSGTVTIEASEPVDGHVNIRTVNGDARVAIPSGSDCRVALSTLRGDVRSSITLQDEARGDSRLTGKLGDGQGSIDISAVHGNVFLDEL